VDVELVPEQAEEVVRAVAAMVDSAGSGPDPWWREGVEEALET